MRTDPEALAIGYVLDNLTEKELDYILGWMPISDREIFIADVKARSADRNKDPYEKEKE